MRNNRLSGLVSLLIAILLFGSTTALAILPPAFTAAQGFPSYSITSLATLGDDLYALITLREGMQVYRLAKEQAQPQLLSFDPALESPLYNHVLFRQGDQLALLKPEEGLVKPLSIKQDSLSIENPWRFDSPLSPKGEGGFLVQALWAKEALYLLYRPLNEGGTRSRLSRFTKQAEAQLLPLLDVQAMSLMPDGRILCLLFDLEDLGFPEDMQKPIRLLAYDPVSESQEDLGKLKQPYPAQLSAFAVDLDTGHVLYQSGNRLFRRAPNGQETLAAWLPADAVYDESLGRFCLLPGQGLAAIAAKNQVVFLRTDQDASHIKPLSIYGIQGGNQHMAAVQALPGQAHALMDTFWDAPEKLSQLLVSQNEDIDLMYLRSSRDTIGQMKEKGYLLDLSSSPKIKAHLDSLYPQMRAYSTAGEAIYFVPVRAVSEVISLTPDHLAQANLARPQTYQDLCQLINDWKTQEEDFPSLRLSDSIRDRKDMIQLALRLGFAKQKADGREPRFDEPELREMLRLALEVPLPGIADRGEIMAGPTNPALMDFAAFDPNMFSHTGSFSEGPRREAFLLSAEPESDPLMETNLEGFAVFSKSANTASAIAYIEAWLDAIPQEETLLLCPDSNQPILTFSYARVADSLQKKEEELKKALTTATAQDQAQLKEQLQFIQIQKEENEQQKYWVTEEAIQAYRQLAQSLFIPDPDFYAAIRGPEFVPLIDRLALSQISLEQFVHQADARLRLMQIEHQ